MINVYRDNYYFEIFTQGRRNSITYLFILEYIKLIISSTLALVGSGVSGVSHGARPPKQICGLRVVTES